MADDIRVDDTAGESDTLPPDLREIEIRFLQDSLVWGADLDGVERLTQFVHSLPGRKTADTAVLLKTLDDEHEAASVGNIEATPLDKHHPVKQSPGEQKLSSPWVAGIAALVIVALLAVVFSTLNGHSSGTTATSTVTAEATATTAEATAILSPTRTPSPTAPATSAAAPVLGPFTATLRIQSNGNNISATSQTTNCASQAEITFEVFVQYSYAPAAYVTYQWRHYNGASPGEPATGIFQGDPTSPHTDIIPTRLPESNLYAYSDGWTIQPPDYTGNTARWGSQFLITAINGKTLATPIASNILHFPTGC